jgi:hypothetical protein
MLLKITVAIFLTGTNEPPYTIESLWKLEAATSSHLVPFM